MNKYGLRNKSNGKLIGYSTQSNAGGESCRDEQYLLDTDQEKLWLVDEPEHAEWVRWNSTEWFNAGYETPTHPSNWDSDMWEVVTVEIVVKCDQVKVQIPTMREYLKQNYEKEQPDHYKYCLKMLEEEGREFNYSLYDLREWLAKKKAEENNA